jgi:Kef-type K+ transport system membrane component KefB
MAGELLVGVLLGPHVAGVIHVNEATTALSDLGVVVLLFTVGLETPLSDLLQVGRSALITSVAGIALALGTALLVIWAFGYPMHESVFAGTALAATSTGVAARLFQDLGIITSRQARVVLGAAVIDDVVTLGLFPLVEGVGARGSSVGQILVGLAGALAFVVAVASLGPRLARRHSALLERPKLGRGPFVLALALCLGLAALAESVGLAALVGAFLAGMVLADTKERYNLDRRMHPLFDFLVPFFFVVAGATMDPSRVFSGGIAFPVVLVLVTLAAKVVGCGGGAMGLFPRERLQVGVGMLPRGEVTLVVASTGVASGLLDQKIFSVLVAVVFVSTLVAPALVRFTVPRPERRPVEQPVESPPESPGRVREGEDDS